MGFTPTQENVKPLTTPSSGSFKNWESETFRLLGKHERDVAHILPRGELTSRVFDRLKRATIRDLAHLEKLLPRVVSQSLIDFGREKSRDSELFVYDYAVDHPAPIDNSSNVIEEQKEILLGDDSPLDDFEKAIIRVTLENPDRFIRRHGQLAQSALADHFHVTQVAIHYRWLRILEKAAFLQAPPDLSL